MGMEGGVKFIFKTLIKVPIYIYVAFLIFNVFAFCFIYFKVLGFSYLVQQTVVENNYIPTEQLKSFAEYLTDFDSGISMVENCNIIISDAYDEKAKNNSLATLALRSSGRDESVVYTPVSYKLDALKKRQYGADVTVGVTCNYVWVWPLDYRNTSLDNIERRVSPNGLSYDVADRQMTGDRVTDNMATAMRVNNDGSQINETPNIVIKYTVPGLKYYPDLS